jgi:hypothetical protein
MPERNTPQKTLESWKQIAAYLDRSERTVRRWETSEGLPVHRREHEKQDTVFAYRHEIEAWSRLRTRCPGETLSDEAESLPELKPAANAYLAEHDAITRTMHCYIAGARAGDGELMRPAFHPSATISGYCQGVEYSGSVEHVFHWVTANGPAPNINPRFARIEIIESMLCIWKFNTGPASWRGPMLELLTCSPCSSAMANGRSRISSSTGTTNDPP